MCYRVAESRTTFRETGEFKCRVRYPIDRKSEVQVDKDY